jgi:ubiquinone/menaquinone biosynthesis C-methylase UbiE
VDPALHLLDVDPSGLRILEIGCGMGRLFEGLSNRFGHIVGIDISEGMIQQGREQCPIEAEWIVGDGVSLSGVNDESVDYVLSFEVFEHIPSVQVIQRYFLEVLRVLKPGGAFQIQLRSASDSPRQAAVRRLPRPLRVAAGSVLERTGVVPVTGDIDTWLGCTISPSDSIVMAESAGFTDAKALGSDFKVSPTDGPRYWIVGKKPTTAVPAHGH